MTALVVDTSVWVSTLMPFDQFHADSFRWSETWAKTKGSIVVPAHFLAEVAGVVSRLSLSASDGTRAIQDLLRDPTFTFAPIDFTLARESAHLASTLRLKGSDAIYVALAQHLDVRLITWDKEQVERGGQVIDVLSPAQALEHLV